MESTRDRVAKVCVIGDSTVGKSSLVTRFAEGTFSEAFVTTIGVDFKTRMLNMNNTFITLQIWDTAGQERFRAIATTYYRGAKGFVIVYDVTNLESFLSVDKWVQTIEQQSHYTDAFKILVGNKCDLASQRQVSYEEGLEKAKQLGLMFLEVSAKTGNNVDSTFNALADGSSRVTGTAIRDKAEKFSQKEREIVKYATCC